MTRTDTPTPSLAKITPEPHACPSPPARNGPCWPATYATAGCMTPSTNGPSAPSRSAPGPEPSTTNTAPPTTPTTKPSAPSATASSASSAAACATTAPTTNTPPGPTACQRRLDKLRTWDVYSSCAHQLSSRARLFLAERHDRDLEIVGAGGDPHRRARGLHEPDVGCGSVISAAQRHDRRGQTRRRERHRTVVDDDRRHELRCPAALNDSDVGLRQRSPALR